MRWFGYLICTLLICGGIFCGISWYRSASAESYINGEINISNKFSQESFSYASNQIVFAHSETDTTNTFYYEKELLKVDGFDGSKNTYQVNLNDYILFAEVKAGVVEDSITIEFYNAEGIMDCSAKLNIKIKFLSNKTILRFETVGNTAAQYLEQYFTDYGCRLTVTQIL